MGTCRNGRLPRSLHRRRRRAPCVLNVRKGGKRVNRVIVVGSPRVDGRSASLADQLMYACIEECPDDVVSIVSVASTRVEPCRGCDACAREAEALPTDMEEGDPLTPHPAIAASDAPLHRCVIADDMPEVRKHLDAADELIVVSPVYFAGPPAQFKALLDRLQPYWRSDVRTRVKRPMILHVVGEGGDPHGFDPLVGCVRSAAAVAGFRLERVLDWVGKIDESGEIVDEADEYPVEGPVVRAFAGGKMADQGAGDQGLPAEDEPAEQADEFEPEMFAEDNFAAQLASQAQRRQNRARLNLGENGAERQVIQLDEDGRRIDAAQHGRKRSAQKKHANAKRGTNGTVQAKHENPHAPKGKGGQGKSGKGGSKQGGGRGKQGKRRG